MLPRLHLLLSVSFPLLFAVAPLFAGPLPIGTNSIEITAAEKSLLVFTYKPTNYSNGPLIIVFHGMNRNADTYRDNAKGMADRFGALVAAPEFDRNRFPSEAYQRGGVTRGGNLRPAPERTVNLVAPIIAQLRRREGRPDQPVYLIGHSAGGQFLTRYAGFAESNSAVRIVAVNPGSQLFPTRDLPFQYGFGNLPDEVAGDDALKRYLARPLTLYLGTADTGEKDLDKTITAMKQGATRIERGRNSFEAAQALAKEKGWLCHWSIVEAPGVGHSSKGMFDHTLSHEALFGAEPRSAP